MGGSRGGGLKKCGDSRGWGWKNLGIAGGVDKFGDSRGWWVGKSRG